MDNRTLQVGQDHIFVIAFHDIYGNKLPGALQLQGDMDVSLQDANEFLYCGPDSSTDVPE